MATLGRAAANAVVRLNNALSARSPMYGAELGSRGKGLGARHEAALPPATPSRALLFVFSVTARRT